MTIQEAHDLINSGEVEATHCGLASNFACWFVHEGTRYMLSEIKGHYIRPSRSRCIPSFTTARESGIAN